MKNCKHKNVVMTIKEIYHYPEGYDKATEKKDYDSVEYLTDECNEITVYCEDCDKYLEQM